MQSNINKQNVNIADEIFTGYSFLSMYTYTKSKNYLKDYIEFPCFLGHPVPLNDTCATMSV